MKISDGFTHWLEKETNKTLEWAHDDEEKLFKELLKKEPTNPSLHYYLENPITYELNNYGFRSPVDYVEGMEGNVFLGCSHTMGIGHYLENTWSWKVNEYVGGNFINLGVGGSGIGTGFRLLYSFKDIVKPKNVFLYYPHTYRFEFFSPRRQNWRILDLPNDKVARKNKKFLLEQNNAEMYYYLHYSAIKNLCYELNIPLYYVSKWISLWPEEPIENDPLPHCSRDGHPPPSFHTNLFEKFKQVYDSKEYIYSKPEELSDFEYIKELKPIL
tara:strand:+ start:33 stop:845 length:813 start_codon:yes stop_codon:yes gene_type:complete